MDGEHARRYEDEARSDHSVIMGHHLDKHEDAEKVRGILKEQDGHFINWYGRFHFEVLDD